MDLSRPPCTADPRAWDLDAGDAASWLTSIDACKSCPALISCRQDLESQSVRPQSVIWAGIALGTNGRILSIPRLRQRAATESVRAAARGSRLPDDEVAVAS